MQDTSISGRAREQMWARRILTLLTQTGCSARDALRAVEDADRTTPAARHSARAWIARRGKRPNDA